MVMEYLTKERIKELYYAVVLQAVRDYKSIAHCVLTGKKNRVVLTDADKEKMVFELRSIERFFNSEFCWNLTHIRGDVIIDNLRKQVEDGDIYLEGDNVKWRRRRPDDNTR